MNGKPYILAAALAVAALTSCKNENGVHEYVYATRGFMLMHNGKPRAALKLQKGHPMLELYDRDGKTARASLAVVDEAVYLSMIDGQGIRRIFMKTETNGLTSIALLDPKTPRIALGLKPSTYSASLQIWDPKGNDRVVLLGDHLSTGLKFHGTSTRTALLGLIMLHEAEKAFMLIFGKNGKLLFGVPKKRR